ncbi:SDR family oxidoreductase [Celeribacter halophilus]|uniref:2-keto-3-deoxy-L-fuconate dehydrogenase n=1 Tax=Celeribacter halophilus TaxID=576117 RepID=A0A1I3T2S9_9RHOB|nr:SDR family oxidoreductase [Celeribacter halophilus]PZX11947.1 2-keto-3-deoxy-L-fuconate dehydrogenase [Celeribacter halophilus]SFJ65235.1 2-keto-3-deoxy-L-fuconate dehydrogenase [Celeribacter halophilus]
MTLRGKTILVTAAGQGIGAASALACAKAGAKVYATDVNADLLTKMSGVEGIETRVLDVTDVAAIDALAAELPDLDGLFNCAGVVHHGTILELDDAAWEFSLNLNITSMVRMCRAFVPGLLRRAESEGSASILNMSSMASSEKGFVQRTAYGATKAAVIGLTKAIAADFVAQNLRCNALCPGTVDTPALQGRIQAAPDPVQAEKDFIARQPMGRLATVDDLTPTVVHLLSDGSSFITGQSVLVDGGCTI